MRNKSRWTILIILLTVGANASGMLMGAMGNDAWISRQEAPSSNVLIAYAQADQVMLYFPQQQAVATNNIGKVQASVFTLIDLAKGGAKILSMLLFLFSLNQYLQYRENPLQVRLSQVVMTFIMAVALMIAVFIPVNVG